MSNADFDLFFAQRATAAERYVCGDAAPLDALVAKQGDASFHSPGGDSVTGAEAVAARYRRDSQSFRNDGTTRFEILQRQVSGDLAFWTGWQVATVRLSGQDAAIDMKIRVTEVFRKDDGVWKLVHRHADMAKNS